MHLNESEFLFRFKSKNNQEFIIIYLKEIKFTLH